MSSPVVTDVFKFLAARPAQRVTEKDTARTVIRDRRAATPMGARELAVLAQDLSQPAAAFGRLGELDHSVIDPLADGQRELTRRYRAVDPSKDPPDARTIVQEAGLAHFKDGSDPKLTSAAWDALYAAHATGSAAGQRLETPMGALRLLHFLQTLSSEPRPAVKVALDTLRATVLIPAVFDEAFRLHATAPLDVTVGVSVVPPGGVSVDSIRRTAQIRALATDLNATERLLEDITHAQTLESRATRTDLDATMGWSTRFTLDNTPVVSDALSVEPSREESAVLDRLRIARTTPAPIAAQMLQSYLQRLNDRATELLDAPELLSASRELAKAMPLNLAPILAKDGAPDTAPDVDVSGRIRPLGIGDLKVVKQTLLAYLAGEVAHIENVLTGESKERTHRKLDRTETTIFTSEEETKDVERDTQSTDRFELKREAAQTVKEDISIKAGLTVTGAYGPVVATATGDFAYSTSKEDSQKASSNFAREVVDRSVTKVQTKTKTERTTKTLNEVEEINKHTLNNGPPSTAHVTGIYRWVDKRYRAQVYNYGARLLLEFVVPEPGAFYRATHAAPPVKVHGTPPHPFQTDPVLTIPIKPLTADLITEFNYSKYAARYGAAGVVPPPPLFTYIGVALAPKEGLGEAQSFSIASKDFVVPAGYRLNSYSFAASILFARFPKFHVQVRGDVWELQNATGGGIPVQRQQIGDVAGNNALVSGAAATSVPVSVVCYDVFAFAVDLQGVCVRTDELMTAWRLDTFGKIQTAYQALQTAYDQKVTQAESAGGITIDGQNPAINRLVEKNELKKLCITMMTGQHFKQFGAVTDPPDDPLHPPEVNVLDAFAQGPIIQFFEQAFEWEQMTYLYYPYFWGRKKNWRLSTNVADPDPLFQQFRSAGAARVLVPVPLPYVASVLYLLQNPLHETELAKKIWRGGEPPTLDDKDGLYVSIAEELRNQTDDLAGATPEGEPWEFTLPTTLVWLQPDDKLPSFEKPA